MKIRNKYIHKFHRFDIEIVISECYLHLDKHKEEITNDSVLISYAKNFIKRQMFWSNGVFMKEDKLNRRSTDQDVSSYTDPLVSTPSQLVAECSPFEIDLDSKYEEFYNTLSTYDKRLFDIYHYKNHQLTREIAEHLNISMTSAHQILTQCKDLNERFKAFLLRYSS
jgi:hypothetical protein